MTISETDAAPTRVRTARAAVLEAVGGSFTVADIELAEPRADEVVVRIVAAGVCHTDLVVQGGGIPFMLPGVLGHEGAGVVEAVGAAVTRVRPGDKVLLSFDSCGQCANCRDGHPALCVEFAPRNLVGGTRLDGSTLLSRDGEAVGGGFFGQSSFSSTALVRERSVVKVADDLREDELASLAPLGCGIQTGSGAVWNVLTPEPGATIAVFGVGAVGLSAIFAAAQSPLRQVIAIDLVDSRLELAREFGATATINAKTEDVTERLRELTGGAGLDYAVETTANTQVLSSAVLALRSGGTIGVIGAPSEPGAAAPIVVLDILFGKTIVGICEGDAETVAYVPTLVDLVRSGRFPLSKLTKFYGLDELNQAAADMHSGATIKPIIRF